MISVHENYRPRLFHLQGRTKPPINTTQQRKKKKKEKNTSGLLPSTYKKQTEIMDSRTMPAKILCCKSTPVPWRTSARRANKLKDYRQLACGKPSLATLHAPSF